MKWNIFLLQFYFYLELSIAILWALLRTDVISVCIYWGQNTFLLLLCVLRFSYAKMCRKVTQCELSLIKRIDILKMKYPLIYEC